ncbi:hypothetical protein F25303_5995 [Fusarium sp. NRRL 25303]|nr:hypothetical protein F25303_5995 [Fusarium sp. NRRL 25303]
MICFLYQSAGEPISKLTKTYISLNTAVSMLAGTSRACIEFAISALTAIALLAFEPFTQAVLDIEDKEVTLDNQEYRNIGSSTNDSLDTIRNVPKIGRSKLLDGASWKGAPGGLALIAFPGPNNTTLNLTVHRNSNDIQEDIEPETSIRLCNWELSSGPVKLPNGIQFKSPIDQSWTLGPGDSLPDVSNPGPYVDWNNGKNYTFIKHKISDLDLSISNYNGHRQCKDQAQPCPDTYLSVRVTTNPGQTVTFGNLSTMIMAIQYLAANESWIQNRTTWEDTEVTAQECALSLCVNEYYDELLQGVLKETVVSSWMDREPDSYTSNERGMKAFMNYMNHSLDMGIMLSDLSDLQIKVPDKDFKRQTSVLPSVMQQQHFNITQPTIIALHNILSDGFGDIRGSNDIIYRSRDYYSNITSKKLIYPALGMGLPTAGFMSGLGESSNIPATLDNVALSLTKWIRERKQWDEPRMVGNTTRMVILTCVRWKYLWFPGTSLVTGILFAILCMWETQKLKKPVLKDSILAAWACALDEDVRLRLKKAVANDDLQEVGRKLEVRWEEDDEFGQLKEMKDDQP